MALKKLDLEKVKEAKDKIITQKAQEYKLIKEKIEKVKQEYLVELESKELNLKKDKLNLIKEKPILNTLISNINENFDLTFPLSCGFSDFWSNEFYRRKKC